MESGLVFYYCGLSRRWHLDWAVRYEYEQDLNQVARVRGDWQRKVKVLCRVVLGSNECTFPSQADAEAYALNHYGRIALPYEPFIDSGLTRWTK